MSIEKRLENLERRTQPTERVFGIVDVRDLSATEATACIAAKRAELDRCGAPATLIILQHQERGGPPEIN
jgi:hypothetical protein